MARILASAHAEYEGAVVTLLRARVLLVAACEEVGDRKTLSELLKQKENGQDAVRSKMERLAVLAILRIPPNDQKRLLTDTLVQKANDLCCGFGSKGKGKALTPSTQLSPTLTPPSLQKFAECTRGLAGAW